MDEALRIIDHWIKAASKRHMQPHFRLFWYLRDLLKGDVTVTEEHKKEAVTFLKDQCKDSEEKETLLCILERDGKI